MQATSKTNETVETRNSTVWSKQNGRSEQDGRLKQDGRSKQGEMVKPITKDSFLNKKEIIHCISVT